MATQMKKGLNKTAIPLIATIIAVAAIIMSQLSYTMAEEINNIPVESQVELSAGFAHSALIDYDGKLYLWGDNTYGQSAAGDDTYIDEPRLIELDSEAVQVSLGAWHTLILTEDGNVYTCGRNTFGQLGSGNWENSNEPTELDGLPKIISVSAGSYHSMALAEDGSLWVWGNNTNGQLAHADSEDLKENDQIVARRSATPEKIVSSGIKEIAAGGHFSVYLDENGFAYAFGDNEKGQLGDGTTESKDIPVQITDIENIVHIRSGYEYALAVVDNGSDKRLYSWGDNSLGQLGIGQSGGTGAMRPRPSQVSLPDDMSTYNPEIFDFADISAGYAHVIMTVPEQVWLEDNETKTSYAQLSGYQRILVWGSNAFGQLGTGNTQQIYTRPIALQLAGSNGSSSAFFPFDAIAAGGSHSLVMSNLGQLAAAGRGNQGQLGTVSVIDRNTLTPVETTDFILPAWSYNQSLAAWFSDDGELTISWSPAQNNRSDTSYRLEITTAEGKIQRLEAGDSISRTVSNLNPAEPLAIKVYAFDAASENIPNDGLSNLYGAYIPEGYDLSSWPQIFDQPLSGSEQKTVLAHSWQPDPSGKIPELAVPWTQLDAYNTYTDKEIETEAESLPVRSIIIMAISAIMIIAVAVWLGVNFHKERFLLHPLRLPQILKEKLKSLGNLIKSVGKKIAGLAGRVVRKIKSAAGKIHLRRKKDEDQ